MNDFNGHSNGRYLGPGGSGPPPTTPSRDVSEDEYVLSLGDLFQVVRQRMWVILATALVLSAAVVGYDLFAVTPQYEATTKMVIRQEEGTQPSGLGSDVQGLQDTGPSMVEAVESRSVADGVIRRLGLSLTTADFLSNLTAEAIPSTWYVEISYGSSDRQQAQQIANATGEEFSRRIAQLSETSATSLSATVWDEASLPKEPASPQPMRDGALALALGLILGTGLAFLMERLDTSWRSPEEVERISGVPTFGVIPAFKVPKVKGTE